MNAQIFAMAAGVAVLGAYAALTVRNLRLAVRMADRRRRSRAVWIPATLVEGATALLVLWLLPRKRSKRAPYTSV
jgi:hypothetical protein